MSSACRHNLKLLLMPKRQDVSKTYLENIVRRLVTCGVAQSVRGVGGGFVLAREPSQIRVYKVVPALEGPLDLSLCTSNASVCERAGRCATQGLLRNLSEKLQRELGTVTLGVSRKTTGISTAQQTPSSHNSSVAPLGGCPLIALPPSLWACLERQIALLL